jgi:predicted nicotinamide N-methyase
MRDAAALLDEPDFARRFVDDDVAPYGLELWPAAVMLAADIAAQEPGHDRDALELGAGLGLVGMVAARAGWRVRVTDHEPTALAFAAYNASANGVDVHEFALLDWKEPPGDRRYDRVFAADVLYQLVDHAPLLRCIKALLKPDGAAVISDPCRGVANRFPEVALHAGFGVTCSETAAVNHRGEPVRGRILTLEPK